MKKQYLKCECGKELKVNRVATGKVAKRRGNSFELAVARYLSRKTGSTFKRTPASGGMEFKGDIFLLGGDLPFILECKNREDIHLLKILKDPEYIADLVHNKQVLIFNQREAVVVYPVCLGLPTTGSYFDVVINENPYIITPLKDFVDVIKAYVHT